MFLLFSCDFFSFWFPLLSGEHNIFLLEVGIGVKLSLERKQRPQGGKDPPWATQLGRVQ